MLDIYSIDTAQLNFFENSFISVFNGTHDKSCEDIHSKP